MIVHHLNCGTCCPVGGRLLDGRSRGLFARLVCHVLLIETDAGLVLVDTGLGMADVSRPWSRLSPAFLLMNNFRLRPTETALAQVRHLGFDPRDVRHIVLTHLDFDHAGGIADFPDATVHVIRAEFDAAQAQAGAWGKRRYRPVQWSHDVRWQLYETDGEPWNGFRTARNLAGLPPELLLVSLIGHTIGHAGIAIETARGWLLHAGDAYVHSSEMERASGLPRMAHYQDILDNDHEARVANRDRLRTLACDPDANTRVFCSHDPVELARLQKNHNGSVNFGQIGVSWVG